MCNNQALPSQKFSKPRRSSRAHNLFFVFIWIFPLCFFPLNVQAGEVTLAWDPPSTEYSGFILSYGSSSGSYSDNQDVGNKTTHTVTNLDAGQTYFFAVKAYNTNNEESSYSNQASATVPAPDTTAPASPKSVQIVSGG
jgi:fibronectin type III domain protein